MTRHCRICKNPIPEERRERLNNKNLVTCSPECAEQNRILNNRAASRRANERRKKRAEELARLRERVRELEDGH